MEKVGGQEPFPSPSTCMVTLWLNSNKVVSGYFLETTMGICQLAGFQNSADAVFRKAGQCTRCVIDLQQKHTAPTAISLQFSAFSGTQALRRHNDMSNQLTAP